MVNLSFCKLDVTLSDHFWQFRSTTFIYFHISLQRDDHSCWIIRCDLLRASELVLAKMQGMGHLLFGFGSRRDHRFRWFWGKISWFSKTMDHDSDMLDASAPWWIFSNNLGRPFRSRPMDLQNFLGSFDEYGRFCSLLCLCIILTWNPIDYRWIRLLLVVHQRIYCFGSSSLCL